jgi:hypothetical protein
MDHARITGVAAAALVAVLGWTLLAIAAIQLI